MELLLEIIIELIIPFVILPILTFIGALLGFIFEVSVFLLESRTSKEKTPSSNTPEEKASLDKAAQPIKGSTAAAPWVNKAIHSVVGLVVLLVASLLVINQLYFEPAVRFIASRVSNKTHMSYSFSSADGNLLLGRVHLKDLMISKFEENKTEFNIHIDDIAIKLNPIKSILFSPITFDTVMLSNVNGEIIHSHKAARNPKHHHIKNIEEKYTKHKDVAITNFQVEKLNMTVTTQNDEQLKLSNFSISSQSLRRKFLLFDLLFSTHMEGTINNNPILITTEKTQIGRSSKIAINQFPASTLSAMIDKPPINWLTDGTLSIQIDNNFLGHRSSLAETKWHLTTQNLAIAAPISATYAQKFMARPVAKYISKRDGNLDLSFEVNLDEKKLKTSDDLDFLWQSLRKVLVTKIKSSRS